MKTIVIIEDSQTIVQILKAYIQVADDNTYKIVDFHSIRDASEFIIDNHIKAGEFIFELHRFC